MTSRAVATSSRGVNGSVEGTFGSVEPGFGSVDGAFGSAYPGFGSGPAPSAAVSTCGARKAALATRSSAPDSGFETAATSAALARSTDVRPGDTSSNSLPEQAKTKLNPANRTPSERAKSPNRFPQNAANLLC